VPLGASPVRERVLSAQCDRETDVGCAIVGVRFKSVPARPTPSPPAWARGCPWGTRAGPAGAGPPRRRPGRGRAGGGAPPLGGSSGSIPFARSASAMIFSACSGLIAGRGGGAGGGHWPFLALIGGGAGRVRWASRW